MGTEDLEAEGGVPMGLAGPTAPGKEQGSLGRLPG